MYPQTWQEVVAFIAAVSPLIIFAWSNIMSAWTRRLDRQRADWLRINQLVTVLYNKNNDGFWMQIAAAEELATFPKNSSAIYKIAVDAREHFTNISGPNNLTRALDNLARKTKNRASC